jgi:hypothetical protein
MFSTAGRRSESKPVTQVTRRHEFARVTNSLKSETAASSHLPVTPVSLSQFLFSESKLEGVGRHRDNGQHIVFSVHRQLISGDVDAAQGLFRCQDCEVLLVGLNSGPELL